MSIVITRREVSGGKFTYIADGEINNEKHASESLIGASKVRYTYASLTMVPDGDGQREVLAFHKTEQAASRGRSDLRKYATGVRVIEIKGESE